MYQGFAFYKNWDFELLNYTPAEYGKSHLLFCPRRSLFFKLSHMMENVWGQPYSLVRLSGGLHHAAVRIAGDNVYRHLKHEGGTHRVQRIPEVGLSSRMQRIHTGTMTVIVLPQPAEVHLLSASASVRVV